MFSQKGNMFQTNNDVTVIGAETVCTFSTGQLPNFRAQLSNHNHLSKKESKVKELWLEMLDGEDILNSGTVKHSRQMSPLLPKRDWTNPPINQLQSVVWEGLKKPTRPIITSVDETTAEQLKHTKRKVPLFVFGQGLSSKAATGGRQMFGFTLGWEEAL